MSFPQGRGYCTNLESRRPWHPRKATRSYTTVTYGRPIFVLFVGCHRTPTCTAAAMEKTCSAESCGIAHDLSRPLAIKQTPVSSRFPGGKPTANPLPRSLSFSLSLFLSLSLSSLSLSLSFCFPLSVFVSKSEALLRPPPTRASHWPREESGVPCYSPGTPWPVQAAGKPRFSSLQGFIAVGAPLRIPTAKQGLGNIRRAHRSLKTK